MGELRRALAYVFFRSRGVRGFSLANRLLDSFLPIDVAARACVYSGLEGFELSSALGALLRHPPAISLIRTPSNMTF